ncbi:MULTISPECIES: DUF4254 domain-containing protein [Nocardia]|nr:DUF4254 domain-containing protein [Nocardia abscessus]
MFGVVRRIRNRAPLYPQRSPSPVPEGGSASEECRRGSYPSPSVRKRRESRVFGEQIRHCTTPDEVLPSADELVHAIRRIGESDHPMAQWASELAELYVHAESGPDHHCAKKRRIDVVHHIDTWTERHIPQHRNGAALHTETLGSVVARIAAASVEADETLATLRPSDPTVHAAWCRLAELLDAYTDLITEVLTGRRRLPMFASVQ